MSNRKITELPDLTTVQGDDVLPIVDTSDTTTKKVSVTSLLADLTNQLNTLNTTVSTINSTLSADIATIESQLQSTNSNLGAHTHLLAHITDSGTSASLDVPAVGDATASQVVKGSDTRLSNARQPVLP
jgi:hypothetical protein